MQDEVQLWQQIQHAIALLHQQEVHKVTDNIVTGKGEGERASTTIKQSFLLVLQKKHQQELLVKYGNALNRQCVPYHKVWVTMLLPDYKTSLGMNRVVATIIPQYESEELLANGLQILKQ